MQTLEKVVNVMTVCRQLVVRTDFCHVGVGLVLRVVPACGNVFCDRDRVRDVVRPAIIEKVCF